MCACLQILPVKRQSTIFFSGYASAKEFFDAQQVVTEDFYLKDDGSGMAIMYGPSMDQHLVIANGGKEGANVLVFTREACESGLASQTFGAKEGTQGPSLSELWESVTGYPVGEAMNNQ